MSDGDLNSLLLSYHSEKLNEYKRRVFTKYDVSDASQHRAATKEFMQKAKYWSANIPIHHLKVVMEQEILERKVKEYDLVNERVKPEVLSGYEDLFDAYIKSINGLVYQNGLSFVFFGHNESGKTMTAIHMLCSAIERGMSGYYITFKDLMNLYNNSEFGREDDATKMWRYVKDCDFLVVDEIGKESKTSENVLGTFEELVKHRIGEMKPTVLITNVKFPHRIKEVDGGTKREGGFQGRYGYSIYNALITCYKVIGFSKRGNFRKRTRRGWFDES